MIRPTGRPTGFGEGTYRPAQGRWIGRHSLFSLRLALLLHGARFFNETKHLPQGYPMRVLGTPGLVMRRGEMRMSGQIVQILNGPFALDQLRERLQHLQLERETFLLLKAFAR